MRVGLAIGLLLVLTAIVVRLASAPLYAVYDAHDCQRAYSRARTIADTARVDLHPFVGSAGAVRSRCGELRTRRNLGPADVAGVR